LAIEGAGANVHSSRRRLREIDQAKFRDRN
jgi:hypothetical protein